MEQLIFATVTQALTFLPLALGVYISFTLLRATDMTLDGSFVLGAAVFARLLQLNVTPIIAALIAVLAGALAGSLVGIMQRKQRIDPLLAGILGSFILTSANLIIMGRPNISLLTQTTLLSSAFNKSEDMGWLLVVGYVGGIVIAVASCLRSSYGLRLRAFGDNPILLQSLGKNVEFYRVSGFALTNCLAATSGCITAQTVGYADIGMGFGVTLTGLGAIIVGQQLVQHLLLKRYLRTFLELSACLLGVSIYFLLMNGLLRMDIDPMYLKMILGLLLVFFLRLAATSKIGQVAA